MKKLVFSFLIVVTILTSAYRCGYYGPNELMRQSWLWIIPDTIYQKGNRIKFDFDFKIPFPKHRFLKTLDSITFELNSLDEKNREILLFKHKINNQQIINIDDTFRIHKNVNIEFNNSTDTSSIYFHEEFYKQGNSRSSDKMVIGKIIKTRGNNGEHP